MTCHFVTVRLKTKLHLDIRHKRLQLFLQATASYGYPINVRTGEENVLVWRNMNDHWGTERRSLIVVSSVHNQRVERFNRDRNVNLAHVFGPKLQ